MKIASTIFVISFAVATVMIMKEKLQGRPNEEWWPILGGSMIAIMFLSAVSFVLLAIWQ